MKKLLLLIALCGISGRSLAAQNPDEKAAIYLDSSSASSPLICEDGYTLWILRFSTSGVMHSEKAPEGVYYPRKNPHSHHIVSCWKTGIQPR